MLGSRRMAVCSASTAACLLPASRYASPQIEPYLSHPGLALEGAPIEPDGLLVLLFPMQDQPQIIHRLHHLGIGS